MISTATAATRANENRGSGPKIIQATKASSATTMTGGHEPAGDLIGQALDRRPAALRLGHHLHDARQHRVASDLLGADHKRAGLIDRAADRPGADLLRDRHRLAGHHRLVDRASARRSPRHRPAPSRPGGRGDGRRRWIESRVTSSSLPSGANAPRRLRREVEKRADGPARRLAGAQFEDLAQQHQHGDHRRRLEVDRNGAIRLRAAPPGTGRARASPPCCRSRRRRCRARSA